MPLNVPPDAGGIWSSTVSRYCIPASAVAEAFADRALDLPLWPRSERMVEYKALPKASRLRVTLAKGARYSSLTYACQSFNARLLLFGEAS